MPTHMHKCERCNRKQTVHNKVTEEPEWPECCGEGMPRVFSTAHRTGVYDKPIEMLSVAVDNPTEIADFRKRNPGVDISNDRADPNFGVPIARTRKQKMSILRNEGYEERN